jgi:hypothetical protein
MDIQLNCFIRAREIGLPLILIHLEKAIDGNTQGFLFGLLTGSAGLMRCTSGTSINCWETWLSFGGNRFENDWVDVQAMFFRKWGKRIRQLGWNGYPAGKEAYWPEKFITKRYSGLLQLRK